jgi:hypothetical protein
MESKEFIKLNDAVIRKSEIAAVQFFIYDDAASSSNVKFLFKSGQGITGFGTPEQIEKLKADFFAERI